MQITDHDPKIMHLRYKQKNQKSTLLVSRLAALAYIDRNIAPTKSIAIIEVI